MFFFISGKTIMPLRKSLINQSDQQKTARGRF